MAEPIQTMGAALIQLYKLLNDTPHADSQGEEITSWLKRAQVAVTFWNKHLPPGGLPISIYHQEIAFNNHENRYQTLLRRHNAHNRQYPNPPNLETDDEFNENIRSWGVMATAAVDGYVMGQHTLYLSSAQAPRAFAKAWEDGWFRGSGMTEDEARAAHAAELSPFHCTALHALHGKWHIFDSAYKLAPELGPGSGSRRLSRVSGLTRFWRLLDILRSRQRMPAAVFTGGGGGNREVGMCRELACRWIIGEVLHIMGDSSRRVVVEAWEELRRT